MGVQPLPWVTKLIVFGPATDPEMVKVFVPDNSYQLGCVLVMVAPGAVIVKVVLMSRISILEAPPP